MGSGQSRTEPAKAWSQLCGSRLGLADPNALFEQDRIEGHEARWQAIGMIGEALLLLVAHTSREDQDVEIIRIISARRASRIERRRYEEANG